MPEKKLNRRVQYTRNALREALVDLAAEKPLQSITVTDICARADINRSTFYLHYKDVHGLLLEIEDDILDHIRAGIADIPLTSSAFAAALSEMRRSTRLLALFRALLGDRGDPQFVRRLQQLTFDAFQKAWRINMPDADANQQLLVYSFVVSGVVSLLSVWIRDSAPDSSAEETVRLLRQLVEHGIGSLLVESE